MNQQLTVIARTGLRANISLLGSTALGLLLVSLAIVLLRPAGSDARANALQSAEPSIVQAPTATRQRRPAPVTQIHQIRQIEPVPTPPVVKRPAIAEADEMVVQQSTGDRRHEEPAKATTQIGFVAKSGNVYEGPGTDYAAVSAVEPGDVVELLHKEDAWWWIQTADVQGWVSTSVLLGNGELSPPSAEAPAPAPEGTSRSEVSGLVTFSGSVYAGPGSEYATIATVDAGTTLELLGTTGAWWQVWVGQSVGWIHEALLLVPPETQEQPAPVAPPAPQPAPAQAAAPAAPARPAAAESLWQVKITPGTIVRLPDVTAPNPYLYADVVRPFLRARTRVLQASGVDYLGHLDEAFRAVDFETTKQGVASMSWHKAGRAVDLGQSRRVNGVEGVVFLRDTTTRNLYRVLIRCAKQDGSLGTWYGPRTLPRGRQPGFYVDVTAIMLSEGFQRIPPQGNVHEAWHYEMRSDLAWSSAMNQLYPVRILRRLYPQVWR
jgi:uncharacterized protein YraI